MPSMSMSMLLSDKKPGLAGTSSAKVKWHYYVSDL